MPERPFKTCIMLQNGRRTDNISWTSKKVSHHTINKIKKKRDINEYKKKIKKKTRWKNWMFWTLPLWNVAVHFIAQFNAHAAVGHKFSLFHENHKLPLFYWSSRTEWTKCYWQRRFLFKGMNFRWTKKYTQLFLLWEKPTGVALKPSWCLLFYAGND